jgi:hypothetical protein
MGREFMAGAILVISPLLSGCVIDAFNDPPPIPSVPVAEVTTPPPQPDTPPLYCRIGRGSALFGHDWYDFDDVDFALERGTPSNVRLTRIHSTQQMTIQALFDGSGQKLIFCPFLNVGENQRISCSSLYALEDDLQDGIRRTFDIPSAVRGGAITCAYQQTSLKPFNPK